MDTRRSWLGKLLAGLVMAPLAKLVPKQEPEGLVGILDTAPKLGGVRGDVWQDAVVHRRGDMVDVVHSIWSPERSSERKWFGPVPEDLMGVRAGFEDFRKPYIEGLTRDGRWIRIPPAK